MSAAGQQVPFSSQEATMRRRNLPDVRHCESGALPMRRRNLPGVRHCQGGELPMRPCGCDLDVRVFGHIICWSQPFPYGKHYTCTCAHCPCTICHKRDG
jgi:hypothetical protein